MGSVVLNVPAKTRTAIYADGGKVVMKNAGNN